jgi:hypothetical protein
MDGFGHDLLPRPTLPLNEGGGRGAGYLAGDLKHPLHLGTGRHEVVTALAVVTWGVQLVSSREP